MQSATDWLETLSPWPVDGFGTERMVELLAGSATRSAPSGRCTSSGRRASRRLRGGSPRRSAVSPTPRRTSPAGTSGSRPTPAGFERAVARVRPDAEAVGATQFEAVTAAAFAEFAGARSRVRRDRGRARRPPRRDERDRCAGRPADERRARAHRRARARRARRSPPRSSPSRGPARRSCCPTPSSRRSPPEREVRIGGAREAAEAFLGRPVGDAGRGVAARPARAPRRRGLGRGAHAGGGRLAARAAAGARRLRRRRLDPAATRTPTGCSSGSARAGPTLVATRSSNDRVAAARARSRPGREPGSRPWRSPTTLATRSAAPASLGPRVLVTGSLYLLADLTSDE